MSIDTRKIRQSLDEYFEIKGDIAIHPDTGIVDVTGDKNETFVILHKKIDMLPVQFGLVSGHFYFGNDVQAKSLKGSPLVVGNDFDCSNNRLTSLRHAPTHVFGDFYCSNNKLKTLQGATTNLNGGFFCNKNQLLSLSGAPKSIRGGYGITVYPTTPLLRILTIAGIKEFIFMDENGYVINELRYLFEKYYPQGRQGILKCGLEMMSIDNGKYATNARMGP